MRSFLGADLGFLAGKHPHSPSQSPAVPIKRARTMAPNACGRGHKLSHSETLPGSANALWATSEHAPIVTQKSDYVERRAPLFSLECDAPSTTPTFSSFRPLPNQTPPPETPVRGSTEQLYDGSMASPATQTPAWMKPFHLVNDEKCIYMSRHGEDWKNHALCLYCFRQHGNFHRILGEGCEVCGREDALESHYWDVPDRL